MFFLQEKKDFNDFKGKILVEGATDKADKKYFIEGIFMQGDIKNQNGRIYPFEVLKEATANYVKEKVLTNRAIGELNHPCLPPDANVFVVGKGLIPITNVQKGDFVYGNDENGNTIESEVLESMAFPFDGNLIEFTSRAFRTKTTPNHRFYINDRKGKQQIMTAETIKGLVADNKLRHYTLPISMNWNREDDEEFIFPKVLRKTVSAYTEEDLSINMNDFCALAGIYLSEGHVQYVLPKHKKYKLPASTNISQNVGENLEKIEAMLSKAGLTYSKKIKREGRHCELSIRDIRIADYFSQFGNCYNKFIPDVILESSKENIETFLYWFNLGDGSIRNCSGYLTSDVFTTSPKLANGLIECILKIGGSTNKKIQLSKQDYLFADRIIEIKNKQPLFRMTIGKNKVKYLDSKCLTITEVPYQGNVYCLTTETGNFWVEHYGSNHLTGNSTNDLDFGRAAIKIEGLKPDGTNIVGRAKVLSSSKFPCGMVVSGLIDEGIQFGVSSRALGSLTETNRGNIVGDDLYLVTAADIVSDPSAPDAYCTAIMEGKEWVWEAGSLYTVERDVKKQINEAAKTGMNEQKLIEIFNKTLNMMKYGEV